MKALAVFAGILLAVAVMFATMGQPTYTDNSGTSVTWSGSTIFDYWADASHQRTERERIIQNAETQRAIVAEEEATRRNRDFWQQFPLTVLAVAALAAAVGASFVGVAWSRRKPATRITLMLNAPHGVERYAAQLGLDDAQYVYDGQWWVVDPVTRDAYQPPPRLAELPGPH